ncbi:MAG: SurA N-terminal domain-containing protein [Bacillota bacterium]|nr:SurA N-terminal domain-containing protein [Bacillota bacterium]MDW7683054.1 SurA N-terminal domain-containing protein [Bacillota bacterium]
MRREVQPMFFRQKRLMFCMAAILVVVMFAAAGCGGSSAKTVAEVNGQAITRGELESYMNILRLFMPNLEPMLSEESRRAAMEPDILDALIESTLLQQAVEELGITVTDAEIEELYENYKIQMVQGMFGSEEDFNKKLKEFNIRESDLIQFIGGSVYSEKLDAYYGEQISEEQIRAFITENPEYGRKPALLELSHILLETGEEAENVRERILAGEDFAELAQELSVDPRAQNEGHSGYRGYLGDNISEDEQMLWPEFMAAAKGLVEEGEISEPVETSDGWHVIKLHKRTGTEELTFEEAREAAVAAMVSEKTVEYLDTFFAQAQIDTFL